jgi:flavin-dependent dehydrogenase
VAFVAHAAGVQDMSRSAELHFAQSGYIGLNPIGNGCTNISLVIPAERAAPARGRVEQFFSETLGEFPEVRDRVRSGELVRRVMATGPFAAWSGRVIVPGALLVGDAADFFDPFSGDGIHAALRGAEMVAETMVPALSRPGLLTVDGLAEYRRMRRRTFAGKWMVERLIGMALGFPNLFERGVARMGRSQNMAHTLIGVAGGFVPARKVLNPLFLARMVL